MANSVCPDCGKSLNSVQRNGVHILKCDCGYQQNLTTGKIIRSDPEAPNCVVQCSNCGGKNRSYYTSVNRTSFFNCSFCGTRNPFLEKPDPGLRMLVDCPYCKGKNSVQANRGKVKVTCNHCNKRFLYNSGTWPGAKDEAQPKQQTKAAPKIEPRQKVQTESQKSTPAPMPQSKQKAQPEPQGGFFAGIKDFFQKQSENTQNEVELVTGNILNKTMGESFVQALSEFLPEIRDYNYIEVHVGKTNCRAFLYWNEDGSRHSKLIKCLEYRPYYLNMRSISGWENCYGEIHSLKARKKVRDEINEVLLASYSFLYNYNGKRLVIMDYLL